MRFSKYLVQPRAIRLAVGFFCFSTVFQSAIAATDSDIQAVTKLYQYVTKPIPSLKIEAYIETHEDAWSEDRVRAFISDKHLENMVPKEAPDYSERLKRLVDLNILELKKEHSGTNLTRVREWISSKMYRSDQLADEGILTNSFKGSSNVLYSTADFYSGIFSGLKSWRANGNLESASISSAEIHYTNEKLWQAYTIESEFGFILLGLLKNDDRRPVSDDEMWPNGSFHGYASRMSEANLRKYLDGKHPKLDLTVAQESLNGSPCVVIRIAARGAPLNGYEYYMDWPDQKRLLKIVKQNVSPQTQLAITRSNFDAEGCPKYWITEGMVGTNKIFRKITIVKSEIEPNLNLTNVFGPTFPKNYIVSDVTSGTGVILQWPEGKPRPTSFADAPIAFAKEQNISREKIRILIILSLLATSWTVIIIFYKKRRSA